MIGALITAFVQPFWSNIISKQSNLHVAIKHSHFRVPQFLKAQIDEYIYNYTLKVKPSAQTQDHLREISNSGDLSQIQIHNRSKRSIEGLVLHLKDSRPLIADLTIDGEKKPTVFARVCSIGTLRAGGRCDVVVWTGSDNTSEWLAYDSITISAKEYDTISVKFPAENYIAGPYAIVSRKILWRTFWTFLIIFNLLTFGLPLFKYLFR